MNLSSIVNSHNFRLLCNVRSYSSYFIKFSHINQTSKYPTEIPIKLLFKMVTKSYYYLIHEYTYVQARVHNIYREESVLLYNRLYKRVA